MTGVLDHLRNDGPKPLIVCSFRPPNLVITLTGAGQPIMAPVSLLGTAGLPIASRRSAYSGPNVGLLAARPFISAPIIPSFLSSSKQKMELCVAFFQMAGPGKMPLVHRKTG